jgi:hypothetical protein
MVTLPISRSSTAKDARTPKVLSANAGSQQDKPLDWTHLLVAGSLVAGGVMILGGRRRAGVAIAAAGTALALLEDQEIVVSWWRKLPNFMARAQDFLDRVEHYAEQASAQGHRIQDILRR